jgi:hypothetical protein
VGDLDVFGESPLGCCNDDVQEHSLRVLTVSLNTYSSHFYNNRKLAEFEVGPDAVTAPVGDIPMRCTSSDGAKSRGWLDPAVAHVECARRQAVAIHQSQRLGRWLGVRSGIQFEETGSLLHRLGGPTPLYGCGRGNAAPETTTRSVGHVRAPLLRNASAEPHFPRLAESRSSNPIVLAPELARSHVSG